MPEQKTVQIGLRVPEEIKTALDKLAEEERRPINTQALILLEEGLKSRGYLGKKK